MASTTAQSTAPFNQQVQEGAWSAGVCGCFDSLMPNCLMSWCCPCVTLAQVSHRVGWMKYSTALLAFAVLTLLTYSCSQISNSKSKNNDSTSSDDDPVFTTGQIIFLIIALVAGVVRAVMVMSLRGNIRKQFHIPGSALEDCCCSFWCTCCVAAQMATHVKSYQPGSCAFAAPDQLSAYEV